MCIPILLSKYHTVATCPHKFLKDHREPSKFLQVHIADLLLWYFSYSICPKTSRYNTTYVQSYQYQTSSFLFVSFGSFCCDSNSPITASFFSDASLRRKIFLCSNVFFRQVFLCTSKTALTNLLCSSFRSVCNLKEYVLKWKIFLALFKNYLFKS